MVKRKNKKQNKEPIVENAIDSVPIIEKTNLPYFLDLALAYEETKNELEKKNNRLSEVKDYLDSNHMLYEKIKNDSFNIQKEVIDYKKSEKIINGLNNEYVFFDFENNSYYSENIYEMPDCYLNDGGNIHICKENGIYVDKERYASAKLFLADKKQIDSNLFYISSFEKILDSIVNSIGTEKKYSYFCMLPESIDVFNTKVRRCLNTSKGKIISVPKSVAVTYCVLDELNIGDRYCVVDMDGLHPVITQLSIGKDNDGKKIILREGFIRTSNIKYDYISFVNEYLNLFEKKYSGSFTDRELDILVNNKNINKVLIKKESLPLFRKDGRLDVIFDETIFKQCVDKYITKDCSFAKCSRVYVVSSFSGLVTGNTIIQIDNTASFKGIEIIRKKLLDDENTIIWKERLPRVSLEVIDDNIGRFKVIDLIEEDNEGQNIRLSVDEDIELPFKGTITLQKGKKEYYLPLEREIYSEDINSAKEAYFYDKSFPLDRDVPVELVVKYNYMSESPIKLYARPKVKISEFQELPNTWVDPHEIEVYSGPIYNGHPKVVNELKWDDAIKRVINNFDRFVYDRTLFNDSSFDTDLTGAVYHKDYKNLIINYKEIRALFDSSNVEESMYKKLYKFYDIDDLYDKYIDVIDYSEYCDYPKKSCKQYITGTLKPISDMIVASWYLKRTNKNINFIYSFLANKTEDIEILSRLSRCIIEPKDDVYNIFNRLSESLYEEIKKSKKKGKSFSDKGNYLTTCVRALSSNCWFNKNWIYNFYESSKGRECINEIIDLTHDFLVNGEYGTSKKFRDILEFLVCISRLKDLDNNILNPNEEKTKEILNILKNSYDDFVNKLGTDKMVSRLITKVDQGPLFGYPNYIYMLIMTLSGEGQVDLVGYHDE